MKWWAWGAAIQAGLKARNEDLKEVVMTDVCPYTMGIEVVQEVSINRYADGMFAPIIERNMVLPTSKSDQFCTMSNNQKHIDVKIYQGENRLVKENIFLGNLSVKVPPRPAGEESIDVRFTYDINGLLEVQVEILSTNEKHALVIEENPGTMTEDEIKKRLIELEKYKIHPRENMTNRTLLAQAERLFSEHLGDARRYLGSLIANFENVLESQDEKMIANAQKEFEHMIKEFENNPFAFE